MASEMVSAMATTTSASIIAIVIINIASVRGIKLSAVALVLASYNCFVFPFPFAGILYMVSYYCIDPYRVYGFYYDLYNSPYDSSYLHLHTVLLAQGKGEVVEAVVEVWIYLYQISFLLYFLCFKWFGYTCLILILGLCYV